MKETKQHVIIKRTNNEQRKKDIDKINQAIFLIKPYFEVNLLASRFTLKYLQDSLKELED